MEEEKKLKMALFRFGVIAPLVSGPLEPCDAREIRATILEREFKRPDGQVRRVPERTLNYWLARYRARGFQGLVDSTRTDVGCCRAISAPVLLRAEELRRELPTRSVRTIISILQKEGFEDADDFAGVTLGRHLNRRGLTRARLSQGAGDYQRFEKERANALWQADTAHGIWLPDPYNPKKVKRTKLIVFVDDASRLVPHAQFYFDEQLPSLVDCLRKALLKRGKPRRLLFDNAFIFHSTTIECMCAELGIGISFAAPFSPSTKGKVERLISSIKSSFYPEAQRAGYTRLDDLNAFFFAWLSKEYHRRVHSSLLKMTPLERWRQDTNHIQRVTPEEIKRALMLRATRRVHVRTGLINLESNTYQASPCLAGENVQVRWRAGVPTEVEIWLDGKCIEIAKAVTPASNIDFARKHKSPIDTDISPVLQSSKNYAGALVSSHHGETEVQSVISTGYLCQEELQALFQRYLQRELGAEEMSCLSEFFVRHTPLLKDIVNGSLSASVSVKGIDRHLRYYLEQIEQKVFGR